MTPDELTELECVIDEYCKEAGAMMGPRYCPLHHITASTGRLAEWQLGMTFEDAWSFAHGYDGVSREPEDALKRDLYAMGARFRERVEAGEYAR